MSMTLRIQCPHCQTHLQVADEHRGKQVRCPTCSSVMLVPAPSVPQTAPVTPTAQTLIPAGSIQAVASSRPSVAAFAPPVASTGRNTAGSPATPNGPSGDKVRITENQDGRLAELGPFQAEYRTGSLRHKLTIVSCILLVLLFGGSFVWTILYYHPAGSPGSRIFGIAFFGFFLAFPLWGLIAMLRLRWRLAIFQNGLVLQRKKGATIMFWKEIKSFYEQEMRWPGGLLAAVELDHAIQLETDTRQKMKLNGVFRDVTSLARAVRQAVHPYLLTRAERILARHEPVSFGNLVLHHGGLDNRKRKLSWPDVESIKVEEGLVRVLTIRQAGRKQAWYTRALGQFPNVDVFLALANRFVQRKS